MPAGPSSFSTDCTHDGPLRSMFPSASGRSSKFGEFAAGSRIGGVLAPAAAAMPAICAMGASCRNVCLAPSIAAASSSTAKFTVAATTNCDSTMERSNASDSRGSWSSARLA